MLRARFIPTLLLKGNGLYKTIRFQKETYIGDPINAVRILNDKAVDELILLDIYAHHHGNGPNFGLIADIVSEAFIPLCYGGGITNLSQIDQLFKIGIEKVAINSGATGVLELVSQASKIYGNQSIVVGIDVKKNYFGRAERYIKSATVNTKETPIEIAKRAQQAGAGELLICSVDRDGTMKGYDIALTRSVAEAVSIPVIACGGAGSLNDMIQVIDEGLAASAAAGSFFVFQGKHRAVLITYPDERVLAEISARISSSKQV